MKITLPDMPTLRERGNRTNDEWLKELRVTKLEVQRSLDDVMVRASVQNRELMASEQRDLERGEEVLEELGKLIGDNTVDRSGVVPPDGVTPFSSRGRYRDGVPLTRDQTFEGFVRARGHVRESEDGLSLGKSLRGVILGEWDGADAERRAMSEAALAGGGYLLPTVLSAGDPSMAWHTESPSSVPRTRCWIVCGSRRRPSPASPRSRASCSRTPTVSTTSSATPSPRCSPKGRPGRVLRHRHRA